MGNVLGVTVPRIVMPAIAASIRPAMIGDLATLVGIDTVAASSPARADEIAAWLARDLCLLAEVHGQCAGYGVLTQGFFKRSFVEMLMVATPFRRKNIGLALLEALVAAAPDEIVFSSTNRSNLPMQSLFARTGFIPSGFVEGLDAGDPELIYRYDRSSPAAAP